MVVFTIVVIVCFIQAAENGAVNLFLPACIWALAENGRACADKGVLASPVCELRASIH